jgi:hypothetical protein
MRSGAPTLLRMQSAVALFIFKFLMSGLATNGPRGPITSGETSGLRLTTTRLPS